ncbi:hypothetical protein [Micromonospora robiginosa]|uniref:Uncharacterized protein n=1 Tax=Micromonospora robiginosa TaxID=2749844 RepID=A0A7L6B0V7_9ACTN|nr:hypothetical protein [Micromonospora ferruginea]QLQ35602.1 hypothetical protein H1D33_19750 [Micromonospora ferruginea]
MTPDVTLASVVYWRRSLWNGMRCVPVLMTLDQGWLRARDRDGAEVFAVPAGQVRGRLTRLSTLLLTVGGRRYAIVGRGSDVSPSPSADQRRELDEFWAHRAPPSGDGAGFLDLVFNGGASFHTRSWRDALARAGAAVR